MNKQSKREAKKRKSEIKKRNKKKEVVLDRVIATGFALMCLCLLVSFGFYLPTHPQKFGKAFAIAPYNTSTTDAYLTEGSQVHWNIGKIRTLKATDHWDGIIGFGVDHNNPGVWFGEIQSFNIVGHENFNANASTEEGVEDSSGQRKGEAKTARREMEEIDAVITFIAPYVDGPSTITVNAKMKTWVAEYNNRGFHYTEGPEISRSSEIIIYDTESLIISKYNLFTKIWQYSLWAVLGVLFLFVAIPVVIMPDT